jgi:hypothetical protein
MNTKNIFRIAKIHTPEVKIIKKEGWKRQDIVSELIGNSNKASS